MLFKRSVMKKIAIVHKLYKYLIRLVKNKKDRTPHYVALTVCVGVVMGVSPVIGQSYLCVLIWSIFRLLKIRFNLIAACAITFISNPLTTPFLYYLFYITGQTLLGEGMVPFKIFVEQLNATFRDEFSYQMLKDTVFELLNGVAKPILIGYIPWGILGGALGYFLGYRAFIKWQLRRQRKKMLANKIKI